VLTRTVALSFVGIVWLTWAVVVLRLADMDRCGLACAEEEYKKQMSSFCGTPDYLAPEVPEDDQIVDDGLEPFSVRCRRAFEPLGLKTNLCSLKLAQANP